MRNGSDNIGSRLKMLPTLAATVVFAAVSIVLLFLYTDVSSVEFVEKYALAIKLASAISLAGLVIASFVFFVFAGDLFACFALISLGSFIILNRP